VLSAARRHAGLVRALREAWGGGGEVLRWSGDYSVASGRAAAARFLAEGRPATAILASSDELTVGVLEVMREAGVAIPRELSLIGFDDLGPLHLFAPPVTAIRQPVEALGARALALLLDSDWSGAPQGEELLPVSLIERESVAPPVGTHDATGDREEPR
jgi:LacI family transcriptional regulator